MDPVNKKSPCLVIFLFLLTLTLVASVAVVFSISWTISAIYGQCSGTDGIVTPSKTTAVLAKGLTDEQRANAAQIIAIGRTRNRSERDIQISLMTAKQESEMLNLSYGHRDSLGIYQQRPSQGWGTADQILDPVYAINKFYAALEKVVNRDSLTLIEVAMAVQQPLATAYTSPTHNFMSGEALAVELLASTGSTVSTSTQSKATNTGIKYLGRSVGNVPAEGMYVGASTFGGVYDQTHSGFYPANNTQGKPPWIATFDDNGMGNSTAGIVGVAAYAELSQGGVGNNNNALGGLPQFTKLEATYNGKSIVIEKRDQGTGQGGATVGGKPIVLDLWWEAAKLLDFKDGNGVIFIRPVDPSTPTNQADSTATPASQKMYNVDCGKTPGPAAPGGGQGWRSPLSIPLVVTSGFGMRFHPILLTWRPHQGTDFGAKEGEPLYAMSDGVVTYAGYSSSAGNFITIEYAGGFSSTYMHMVRPALVQKNTRVTGGQLVGNVGSTGLSTAPHLHLEWLVGDNKVDPIPQLCTRGINIAGPKGCSAPSL